MVPPVLNLPSSPATAGGSSIHTLSRTHISNSPLQLHTFPLKFPTSTNKFTTLSCYSKSNISPAENSSSSGDTAGTMPPPVLKKKKRYRKHYPGEKKGISEEMRFVAMRLRNSTRRTARMIKSESDTEVSDREIGEDWVDKSESENGEVEVRDVSGELISTAAATAEMSGGGGGDRSGETWEPTVEGFVNYLVNSKLVFETLENVVDDSSDVSYAYFRNTGLERSESLSEDLEWFRQQDVLIPEPSKPGISYAKYLRELSETKPPLFLSHFYNIYFSHIAGGQVITNQVSKRIFKGRKLEFCRWQGNEEELLRGVRENLNMLGEHWPRHEKSKCLAETKKAFQYMGQIVRLIIA